MDGVVLGGLATSTSRILLVVHGVLGAATVAICTHLAVWSFPYLTGKPARHRGVRTFALVGTMTYAAQFALGMVLYPTYALRVKLAYLTASPSLAWVARLFDVKEHWVALGLPLALAAVVFSVRRPAGVPGPVWPRAVFACALGAAVCAWMGGLIGLYASAVRSIGSL
jgi:hypothetical protein